MGILLFIVGLFIMGGPQMVVAGLAGLAIISVFVTLSMAVGKLFRL